MARLKLTETKLERAEILERDSRRLGEGILSRVKYNICNLGELNRNKRIYEKDVWEKVLSDSDIKEKLEKRSLYAHAEHPEGMQSSTEKIAGIVTEIKIQDKNVYAIMEILDTPYGRICDSLLRAGCGLGTSTRAEGELEERIDETSGNRYYRVVPESYNFVTVDWTADPSTYGAFPESVERDITGIIKSGCESNKIDLQYATTLLERMKCKEAVSLCESIKKDMNETHPGEPTEKCGSCGGKITKEEKENFSGKCVECSEKKKNESIVIDDKFLAFIRQSAESDPMYKEFAKQNASEALTKWIEERFKPKAVFTTESTTSSTSSGATVVFKSSDSNPKTLFETYKEKSNLTESKRSFTNMEVEVDDGKGGFVTYRCDGIIEYYLDKNYGADADGNRGTPRLFIEEVIVEKVIDENGSVVQLTPSIEAAVNSKVNDMDLFESKKRIIESGPHSVDFKEVLKELEKVGDDSTSKKLSESKTAKEKVSVVIGSIKELRESLAISKAENSKLVEIAENYIMKVRNNYTKDVLDFNKKLEIVKEELDNTHRAYATDVAKYEKQLIESIEANKKALEEKITLIEKTALESTQKIYEAKFKELKDTFDKEVSEAKAFYNGKLMKLLVGIKVKEAALESELQPKHLALLESLETEQQIEAKLDEFRLHLREGSFHSNEFKRDKSLVVMVNETKSVEQKELESSLNQTLRIAKSLK